MANAPLRDDTPLTAKHIKFIEAYVALGNATKAAIAAGYSERSAAVQGSQLLKEPKIRREVDRRNQHIADECGATKQYVIERLMREAETSESGSARVRALELLGRAHTMFKENVDVKHTAEFSFKLNMGELKRPAFGELESGIEDAEIVEDGE